MAQPAGDPRRALYEQYQKISRNRCAEIIRGTLHVTPRPAPLHANATTSLAGELSGPFQRGRGGPGGWWILFEPELHLVPLEPMVPDLAGWRRERMPSLPSAAYFSVVPDWICETISKSTESTDRNQKLPLYAELAVTHVWLMDPIAQTLEAYTLGEPGHWREVRTFQGDEKVRVAPFDDVEIELAELWGDPP